MGAHRGREGSTPPARGRVQVIAHGDRHSVAMPINLLAALSAFASTDDMRPSMRGVLVKNTELMACDGHRLVRVDMIHDAFDDSHIGGILESPYTIPLRAITACVAAAKAIHAKRVRVWREALTIGKPIRLEVSTYTDIAFVMEAWSTDLGYPPTDQLMNAGPPPTDFPPEIATITKRSHPLGLTSQCRIGPGWDGGFRQRSDVFEGLGTYDLCNYSFS